VQQPLDEKKVTKKIKALDATLHLIAKHPWRVLQPLRFLNPLGSSKLNDAAYALLLAAAVSSKAVRPYAQEPRLTA